MGANCACAGVLKTPGGASRIRAFGRLGAGRGRKEQGKSGKKLRDRLFSTGRAPVRLKNNDVLSLSGEELQGGTVVGSMAQGVEILESRRSRPPNRGRPARTLIEGGELRWGADPVKPGTGTCGRARTG